jgi:hypothetical protein
MPGALLEAVLQCRGKAWDSKEPVWWESGNAIEAHPRHVEKL